MPLDRQSESLRGRLDAYIRECIDADAWPTAEEIMHIVSLPAHGSPSRVRAVLDD